MAVAASAAALRERLEQQQGERDLRWTEISLERRDREEALLPPVARTRRQIALAGDFDRGPSGLIRLRRGLVHDCEGGELCIVTIQALGGDLLLRFSSQERAGHGRDLVALADGGYFLETEPDRLVPVHPDSNKYAAATATILALRAHETDLDHQTDLEHETEVL